MANGVRLDTLKTRRILGGWSISRLAKRANVSDLTVKTLEDGGNVLEPIAQRILDALGPPATITENSQANPTEVTTAAAHQFQTGDTVLLAGIADADADPNGSRVVTRTGATTFTVPVNCTVSGGTGGTATIEAASVSLARL